MNLLYLVLCIGLGILIYKKKILDLYGTIAATFIGAVIAYSAGFEWFLLLVVFLFLAYLSTKYKYDYKDHMKVAERNHGRRGASNVLANGIVPALFAVLWYFNDSNPVSLPLKASYIAAVATVTGDTISSEIGVLSKNDPILITTFERVPRGTDGGVSLLGEVTGIISALIIGLIAWDFGLASFKVAVLAAVIGGTAGFHFDSILGAVFERKKVIGNGTVNFLSTIVGALTGFYIALSV